MADSRTEKEHLSAVPDDPLLTTDEVADRYRTSSATVRYWRHVGEGPTGTKFGRRVLYALSDVLAWEKDQREQQLQDRTAAAR